MAALPYFPFYPRDWLSDPKVTRLPLEARGAYIHLLASMWEQGDDDCGLPDDDRELARILGVSVKSWKKCRSNLVEVLRFGSGRVTNTRLQREHQKAVSKSRKAAQSAHIKHANAGANAHANADANAGAYARPNAGAKAGAPAVPPIEPEPDPEGESVPSGLNGRTASEKPRNAGPVAQLIDRWRECPNVPHDQSDGGFFAGIWRAYKGMEMQTILDAISELDVLTTTRQLDGDPRKYLAAMLERKRDEQRKKEREEQEQRDAEARRQAEYLAGIERNGESIQRLDELAKDPEQRKAIVRKMREERAKIAQGGVEDAGAPVPF